MKQYNLVNNIFGWFVFLIAATVYIITSEPTASFWDCGEYIATAYKLQVGHPPGAPLFQMLGRFFSLFAFGDVSLVARMVNTMSALASAFTILFLFWSITALGRKLIEKKYGVLNKEGFVAIIAAGFVGAMSYTFSDSFWFSAVEGEVYATSSFFTAIVFWAILKWERVADNAAGFKWIILICFLIGLSTGVHLLNLLAIPAITMVYYFKKWENPNIKGALIALFLSFLILVFIMSGIIPEVVNLFAHSEIIFVNGLGMPFNTGTLFFAGLLAAFLIAGIRLTHNPVQNIKIAFAIISSLLVLLVLTAADSAGGFFVRLLVIAVIAGIVRLLRQHRAVLNAVMLGLTFILIGYSSFFMLVIRSNAGTPINENSPKDAIALLSYLNREQYGDWPVFYGNYYNAPLDDRNPYLDGKPVYGKNRETGKYVIIDKRDKTIPNYVSRYCTVFPRMWSQQESHIREYKSWAGIKNDPENKRIPTFVENMRYFLLYQTGHMYLRYFMWNFAGRQNDLQGHGGIFDGNWLSGIKFLDNIRLGPQMELPPAHADNKATNNFFMLPLILGFIGFFYHLNNNSRDTLVVGLLFFMTGLAITIYLNQYPIQPRERDYAYAASFYAFAVWIGLGVIAVAGFFAKKLKPLVAVLSASALCLIVPAIMAAEGWDDHNRSGRYTAIETAENYLNACEKDAILFTFGDNDTFPLWYAQEVEGVRTDVRVVNLSLLSMDWYISQMKTRLYNSPPLPLSIPESAYIGSKREVVWFYENTDIIPEGIYADIRDMISFAISDNPQNKLKTRSGKSVDYFPTSKFCLPVDKALVAKYNSVPANMTAFVADSLKWNVPNYALTKSHLILMDIIAGNNWKRPVYFSVNPGVDEYMGLEDYLYLEGMSYRLLPVKKAYKDDEAGSVNTDVLYKNLVEEFQYGSYLNPDVYLDETNIRTTYGLKSIFLRLCTELLNEGKNDSAVKVVDKCLEILPPSVTPYDYYSVLFNDCYFYAGAVDKGNELSSKMLDDFEKNLIYYFSFTGYKAALIENEKRNTLAFIKRIEEIAKESGSEEISKRAESLFNLYARM